MSLSFIEIVLYTIQLIALVVAIINYRYNKETHEKYFIFFLAYAILTEWYSISLRLFDSSSSFVFFNIYTLVSISFYLYYISKNTRKRTAPFILWSLFLLVFIYDTYNDNIFDSLLLLSIIIGHIFIIILSGMYFISLLYEDEPVTLVKTPSFWIISGLLLFSLGIAPLLFFGIYLNTLGFAYNSILLLLNVILFGSFAVGLWIRRR